MCDSWENAFVGLLAVLFRRTAGRASSGTRAPLRGMEGDWRAALLGKETSMQDAKLWRSHEGTDRPPGTDEFIGTLKNGWPKLEKEKAGAKEKETQTIEYGVRGTAGIPAEPSCIGKKRSLNNA